MPEGKTLYLMRHADAAWPKSGQRDFERSLSARGENDARKMGQRLQVCCIQPDVVLTSPARRAVQTLEQIKQDLGIPLAEIRFEQTIYEADTADLFNIVHALEDSCDSAMIIGHNPALTWFINQVTGEHIANTPTASLATLHTISPCWRDFGTIKTTLQEFDYPQKTEN
jgi:phosphohistidine phosphatase